MTFPVKVEKHNDDIEDPVERMLKKTGCIELHYEIQVKKNIDQNIFWSINWSFIIVFV